MVPYKMVEAFAKRLVRCREYMENGYCKKEDCEHCSQGDALKYISNCTPEEKAEIFHEANFLAAGGDDMSKRRGILFKKKWKKIWRILMAVNALLILQILKTDWPFVVKVFVALLAIIILYCLAYCFFYDYYT